MFKSSEIKKLVYKTGEVAKLLGVTPMTVINYDRRGLLKMSRTPAGRRFIRREDLLKYLKSKNLLLEDTMEKRDVIYTRVDTVAQKEDGDLDRQVISIIRGTCGLCAPVVMSEVGSGDDDSRPELRRLIGMVLDGEVLRVFVTKEYMLAQAGYFYLKTLFEEKGVGIVVVQ